MHTALGASVALVELEELEELEEIEELETGREAAVRPPSGGLGCSQVMCSVQMCVMCSFIWHLHRDM